MKLSLVKLNLFYLQMTQRKRKKGDGCTGEKTIHTEIYIMFETHKNTFFLLLVLQVFFGGVFCFFSYLENTHNPTPAPSLTLSLSVFFIFFFFAT